MSNQDALDFEDSHEGVVQLSQEARNAAARAAEAAGMSVSEWLSQLIKYAGSMAEQKRQNDPDGTDESEGDTSGGGGAERTLPVTVSMTSIRPGAANAQTEEDDQAIQTCLTAYRETGKFPPITVRRVEAVMGDEATLEVVAGEQRWHAARKAQLRQVPVVIQNCSNMDALIYSVREAKRHYKLPPVTEARCYARLLRSHEMTPGKIASAVAEPVDHVVETLNLLSLPRPVQKLIDDGVLSRLHARALLKADDPEAIAWEIAGRGLDIYQTEQMVRSAKARSGTTEADGPSGYGDG